LRGVPSCRLPAIGKLGSCRHGEQAGVRRSAADDSPLRTRVHEFMLGQDASRQGAVAVAVLPGRTACVAWGGTSNNAPCAMDTRPTESGWQWQPGKPAHFSLALKSDRRSTSQLQLVVLCVV